MSVIDHCPFHAQAQVLCPDFVFLEQWHSLHKAGARMFVGQNKESKHDVTGGVRGDTSLEKPEPSRAAATLDTPQATP